MTSAASVVAGLCKVEQTTSSRPSGLLDPEARTSRCRLLHSYRTYQLCGKRYFLMTVEAGPATLLYWVLLPVTAGAGVAGLRRVSRKGGVNVVLTVDSSDRGAVRHRKINAPMVFDIPCWGCIGERKGVNLKRRDEHAGTGDGLIRRRVLPLRGLLLANKSQEVRTQVWQTHASTLPCRFETGFVRGGVVCPPAARK